MLELGATAAGGDLLSDGEGDRGYQVFVDSEIYLQAELEAGENLAVGASVTLITDTRDDDEINADETFLYLENGFGLVQLGRTEGAEDNLALGADVIAAGTGGIDGDTANLGEVEITNSGDAAKISYFTPRLAGLQFGVSYTPDTGDAESQNDGEGGEEGEDLDNHVGVGVNLVGALGDVEAGLAVVGSFGNAEQAETDNLRAVAIGGTAALDAIELGASFGHVDQAEDVDFATVGVTIGFGEAHLGVGYNYVDESTAGVTHVTAFSGDVEILKGIELQGDVSYSNLKSGDETVACVVGVELSF
ncbi:MAG: porin [Rhizobiales bacterium]|nr:porin [Hyphomicrobiales bacterium]